MRLLSFSGFFGRANPVTTGNVLLIDKDKDYLITDGFCLFTECLEQKHDKSISINITTQFF